MTYECHITTSKDHAAAVETLAADLHWKYSCIDGDPVLGKQAFAYLTTHDVHFDRMLQRMRHASLALEKHGVPVLREKIELIVFDTKRPAGPCQGVWRELMDAIGA